MARRYSAADRQIETRLERAGLPTIFFNRPIVSYDCESLRTFVRYSDNHGHLRDELKLGLCLRLARLNGGQIDLTEQHFLRTLSNQNAEHRHDLQHIPARVLARTRGRNAAQQEPLRHGRRDQYVMRGRIFNAPPQTNFTGLEEEVSQPTTAADALFGANLNRVVVNTRNVAPAETRECQSCLEALPVAEFGGPPRDAECNHGEISFCTNCFEQHIIASVESSPLDQIPCPELDCPATLGYEQMRLYAPLRIFHRYSAYINEAALAGMRGYMECSDVNCENSVILEASDLPYMRCDACGQRTCTTCRTPWHDGFSHQENMDNIQRDEERRAATRANQEVESQRVVERISKACPNQDCGARIRRAGGCNHMTCPRCRHQFCWDCLAPWNVIHRCVIR